MTDPTQSALPRAAKTDADMRAFGASDAPCYKYPDDTELDRACRAAYIAGAAETSPVGEVTEAMLQAAISMHENNEAQLHTDQHGQVRTYYAGFNLTELAKRTDAALSSRPTPAAEAAAVLAAITDIIDKDSARGTVTPEDHRCIGPCIKPAIRAALSSHPAPAEENTTDDLTKHFPTGLCPQTVRLIRDFALALAAKLRRAEEKYGYDIGWLTEDWESDCRRDLVSHITKGDPLDVAAFAAFMWRRGWSTSPAPAAEVAGERAEFKQQAFGADVATILETEDTLVEVVKLPRGQHQLVIHNRRGETDQWDDLSATMAPHHLAALGSIAAPSPAAARPSFNRVKLLRVMCHAAPASCKCADKGGMVDDYEACRIVSRHANAILAAGVARPSAPEGEWKLQAVLNRYRYAVAYAAADAWDGGLDLRRRFEWARSNDPARQLTDNEIAGIGKKFHAEFAEGK